MAAVAEFLRVVQNDALSEYTLGSILGPEITAIEKGEAEEKAVSILQHLRFLPSEDDAVLCEEPLVDAAGNPVLDAHGDPELCGKIFSVSWEPARTRLGFRWRCLGNHMLHGRTVNPNRRHTDVRKNPMDGYMFVKAQVDYRKFLKFLYGVFMQRATVETHELVGGSTHTTVNYRSLIKEALAVVGWHDQGKVGGAGDVVEVDEVRLVKRKYNRGRIPVGDYWVFGGTSRKTKRRFAMRVPHRNRITLLAEITDSIEPGSIICTDGWAAYEGIMPTNNLPGLLDVQGNVMYKEHHVVIHERQFVEPTRTQPPLFRNDIYPECRDMQFMGPMPFPLVLGTWLPYRIHTQAVERQWRELRESVESSQDLETVDRKKGHWLYRENVLRRTDLTKSERFLKFCEDITRVYPGPNMKPIRANRPGARVYPNQQPVLLCECDQCA